MTSEDRGNPQGGKTDRCQGNPEIAGDSRILIEVPTSPLQRHEAHQETDSAWCVMAMDQRTRRSNGESKEADALRPQSELIVECDASERGLGTALLQSGKPIRYCVCKSCAHQHRNSIRKSAWPLYSRWDVSISIRSGEEQSYTVITSHWK